MSARPCTDPGGAGTPGSTDPPRRTAVVPIAYTARGYVPRSAAADALHRIERVLSEVPGQVLRATVTLAAGEDPAPPRSVRVEAGAVVNGVPVRARVTHRTFPEAIDLAVDRLQRRLAQLRARPRIRHRWLAAVAEPEWQPEGQPQGQYGDLPAVAPPIAPDRPVIRRKLRRIEPMTTDEAAYEMDLLDHRFYLFADVTGAEAVISRTDAGGYELITSSGVPVLTLEEAKERVAAGPERFVFYRDSPNGQGRVLYARHDGRFGLLLPA